MKGRVLIFPDQSEMAGQLRLQAAGDTYRSLHQRNPTAVPDLYKKSIIRKNKTFSGL